MNWIIEHRALLESIAAVIVAVEQTLPHLPIKANSTVQLVFNLAKAIIGKKA